MLNELIYTPEIHIENNIKFRIESSKVLSHYKISQSTVFSEIYQNPIHKFSKTAKEIILAKYDTWFIFLIDIEHLLTLMTQRKKGKVLQYILEKLDEKFIREDEKKFIKNRINQNIKASDIKQLIKIFALYRNRIMSHLFKDLEIFDKEFIEIWQKFHKFIFEHLLNKIINIKYEINNPIEYFNNLGYFLTLALHHTLYEVYEIDCFCNNKIVLNYDKIIDILYEEDHINLLIKKIKILKSIRNIKEIQIKIYFNKNENIIKELENYCNENNLELIIKE